MTEAILLLLSALAGAAIALRARGAVPPLALLALASAVGASVLGCALVVAAEAGGIPAKLMALGAVVLAGIAMTGGMGVAIRARLAETEDDA